METLELHHVRRFVVHFVVLSLSTRFFIPLDSDGNVVIMGCLPGGPTDEAKS